MEQVLSKPAEIQARSLRLVRLRWAWLLLAAAGAALWPVLRFNITVEAYDAATEHLYRAFVYSYAITHGAIYPRWVQFLNWGLGSPLFSFLPPLPYAGMDLLYRLGVPHVLGWRVLMFLALCAGCTGAYALGRVITGRRWPALLAAVTFLYAPYVLRNIFERGEPEALAVALFPWVLWSVIWLARKPSGGRLALCALLFATCISAHVLAPLILAPVAGLVALLLAWHYRTAMPVLGLLAGGLLVAFIWLPMVPEQGWVTWERDFSAPYANPVWNPIPLDRLLAAPAVYDTGSDSNNTGDRFGWMQAAFLVAGLPALYLAWKQRRRDLLLALGIALVSGWLAFWLLTSASDPLWRALQPFSVRVQYRFRLMSLPDLASAAIAGIVVALLPRRWQPYVSAVLAGLIILLAMPALYTGLEHQYSAVGPDLSVGEVRQAEIASGGSSFTAFGEFQPRWRTAPFDQALLQELGPNFDPSKNPLAAPAGSIQASAVHVQDGSWDMDVEARVPATLTLHLLYYPRWQAQVDGRPVPVGPQPQTGYVQLAVPAGAHHVSLRFGSTSAEKAGLALSGLAFFGLLGGVAVDLFRRRREGGRAAPLSASEGAEAAPPWWLLAGLTGLLVFKIAFVDPSTSWLRCQSTQSQVCGAQVTVDVPFPGAPRLRGYSVPDGPARPGDALPITLFWQSEPGTAVDLDSFVHIRNSQKPWPMNPRTGDEIWAQSMHTGPGNILTTRLVPGKLYSDEFRVQLPSDLPPGTYFLEIGWYDPASGQQLDPQQDAVKPPLKVLWRSILLPSIQVR